MTQISYPFDGRTVGDAGSYDAGQWATAWLAKIGGAYSPAAQNGSYLPGTHSGGATPLEIEASGVSLEVTVYNGEAIVRGYFYRLTADDTLSFSANSDPNGYDRIDRVILRLDRVNQTVRLAVLEGTPAASPSAPALTRTSSIWEVTLAQVTVRNSATTITSTDVTDERTSARFAQTDAGGTGVQSASPGDILVGNASGDWSVLNVPNDTYRRIVSSPSTGGSGLLAPPLMPTVVSVAGVDYSVAAGFTALDFNEIVDPGNFAAINSGAIDLDAGIYKARVKLFIFERLGADAEFGVRLYNVTDSTPVQSAFVGDGTQQTRSADLEIPATELDFFSGGKTIRVDALCSTGDGRVVGSRCLFVEIYRIG